jgi:putative phosphoribosyl transferase
MPRPDDGSSPRGVQIDMRDASLQGDLSLAGAGKGIVLFAHGSGSSRKSRRNRFVAEALGRAGLATLLFDLLTEDEEESDAADAHLRFDTGLLARRLVGAIDWTRQQAQTRGLHVGCFGASTGAAAALMAAVERADDVRAVVSRGGRPDLAGDSLDRVRAPTLLIVGGADPEVLAMNGSALERLRGPKSLSVVPDATHLFEEPGALEQVAQLAADWFQRHLGSNG